jgi:hypothetical protein
MIISSAIAYRCLWPSEVLCLNRPDTIGRTWGLATEGRRHADDPVQT